MTSVATAVLTVRPAVGGDNEALVALAAACTMRGELALRIERAPDFFALARQEGARVCVGVVEHPHAGVVGCLTLAERRAWVNGVERTVHYVGDYKVHPAWRGGPAADALARWAAATSGALSAEPVPVLLTILHGNRAMERRAAGPRGLPRFRAVGVVRAWSVPLLGRRVPVPPRGARVAPAREGDVEEMAALWRRVMPARQFATVHDATSLAAWVRAAPGLALHDYLLARDESGTLVGFLAVWRQDALKQMRVVGWSPRLALARRALNLAAPALGMCPLPAAGAVMPTAAVVHLCVAPGDATTLRALLAAAYRALAGTGRAFLTLGLDRDDPSRAALRGLLAQPTDVGVWISGAGGEYAGPALDARPIHHETALV
ncbi:MAG TPA: hypothetical protein VFY16_07575 [Gemmatimonadaceae bacterium]|nr:hypothetical protein [Gemmatimonadaceae bacterium]